MTTTITTITIPGSDPAVFPIFDDYLMVDWSAASKPRTGPDSIWFCHLQRSGAGLATAGLQNPPTRHLARRLIRERAIAAVHKGRRILIGFDFPFAYPAGLAARLGLAGAPWRAIWDEIAVRLHDDEENISNRFAVAAALNRRISDGIFPFWGCPAGQVGPYLAMRHHRRFGADGLAERRLVDLRAPRAQPGWKLFGAGSAGSQALTGIPVVNALRAEATLAGAVQVWPFETGLRALAGAEEPLCVLAEIYPSILPLAAQPGEAKDSAQVRSLAAHFAALDDRGGLGSYFAGDPALTAAERTIVEREEGWVLGIAAAAPSIRRPQARAA
jgi:precorrin-8X/cobalt-precorrin-8 methylmutase